MIITTIPLEDHHDRASFSCGNGLVDEFLHDIKNLRKHKSFDHRIHVCLDEDQSAIIGYYCLQFVSLRYKKNIQPDLLLKMIGVSKSWQEKK